MRFLLIVAVSLAAVPVTAHEFFSTKITWSREISRLVYKRCASCHHDGGKAFSLLTYEVARPWAKAIKEEVLNRRMPPWGAVKGFGEFKHDRGLTQEEISLFADWVEGGAPEGDKTYLPKAPSFPGESASKIALRKPAVRKFRGSFTLPAATIVRGIAVAEGAPAKPVQIVATRPDGTVEPLIWVLDASRASTSDFEFRSPLVLPAGTTISADPPAGDWTLLLGR